MLRQLELVLSKFKYDGEPYSCDIYGNGHINTTYKVECKQGDKTARYILQRINNNIFPDTAALMENIENVTDNPNDDNRLLNLGNEEAWEYCFETLSKLIEELNIDCYRQDFNFSPLAYWRKNDDPDRKGITEIKHITVIKLKGTFCIFVLQRVLFYVIMYS